MTVARSSASAGTSASDAGRNSQVDAGAVESIEPRRSPSSHAVASTLAAPGDRFRRGSPHRDLARNGPGRRWATSPITAGYAWYTVTVDAVHRARIWYVGSVAPTSLRHRIPVRHRHVRASARAPGSSPRVTPAGPTPPDGYARRR
ncbi:hypothetical protein GCM10022220_51290 [Actinocatenispora rupis]|uniref:Uncharacterized protein n=1 Tax=Actinocatenispora rupis TaxID=519421 RepID=A0A8J3NGC9_9ACTN|nr:hypothetical protein Aru02nite_67040 [Actinocatenispora rupis]